MSVKIRFLIYFYLINLASTKVYVIIDETLKSCKNNDNRLLDWSNYHLVPYNDTHTFINGTLIFLQDIISPFPAHFHAEKFDRGQWVAQMYAHNVADVCQEFHNPLRPWAKKFAKLKGCPIQKGTKWNFDMESIDIAQLLQQLPPNYSGRWRVIFDAKYKEDNIERQECKIVNGDIFVE